MGTDCTICSNKCWGHDGQHGLCCRIEDRDWIIGPHTKDDSNRFIKDLSEKFGREIKHNDVFIEYDEGSKQFPHKKTWRNPQSYPALKINKNDPSSHCIFYNITMKACSVYSIRPKICRDYECEYLKDETNKK